MSNFAVNLGTGLIEKTTLENTLESLAANYYGINVANASGTFTSGAAALYTFSGLTLGGVALDADEIAVQYSNINFSINTAGSAEGSNERYVQVSHTVDPALTSSGVSSKNYFPIDSTTGSDFSFQFLSFWSVNSGGSYSFEVQLGNLYTITGNVDFNISQAENHVIILKKVL